MTAHFPRGGAHSETILARDLLRDFCVVHATLTEQAARFAHSQTISYAVLRELLGEATHKGVFWRLKDTAHHLFRKSRSGKRNYEGYGMSEDLPHCSQCDASEAVLESLLDWCLGYAFHECVKLKEDAFQRQHYTNRLTQLDKRAQTQTDVIAQLKPFTEQTTQSIEREVQRLLGVLHHTRDLLIQYLSTQEHNGHVARFLANEEHITKQCFDEQWPTLLQALYGQETGRLYVFAAQACLEGGHPEQAIQLVEKARHAGISEESLQEILLALQALPAQGMYIAPESSSKDA